MSNETIEILTKTEQKKQKTKIGPIAQLVERPAHNRLVPGSSPGGPTLIFSF